MKVHSTLFFIRLKAFKGKVKGKVIRFNLIIYKVEATPGLGLQWDLALSRFPPLPVRARGCCWSSRVGAYTLGSLAWVS